MAAVAKAEPPPPLHIEESNHSTQQTNGCANGTAASAAPAAAAAAAAETTSIPTITTPPEPEPSASPVASEPLTSLSGAAWLVEPAASGTASQPVTPPRSPLQEKARISWQKVRDMSKVIMYYNRRGMAVQIAGHKDAFRKMTPDTVCKEANPIEKRALEILMTDPHMRQVVPLYHGQLTVEGKDYLQLEDLLKPFKDPIVMDIKMGLRTFLESEVSNQKLRSDLLKKLLKLDKTAATAEELEQDGITKLRYMQYREQQSSSSTLGFRIEGQKLSGREVNNDFKSVRLRSDVLKHLREYIRARPEMKTLMGQRLRTIRTACEESAFFRTHECIGSSLLFAYDLDGPFNIWCIDFGKTIECDHQLSHRAEWVNGNHEDGYLKGVDELISLFDDL